LQKKGIKPVSAATIARIIRWLKDRGEILDLNAKVSLYGKTGKMEVRERKKKKSPVKVALPYWTWGFG